MVKYLHDYANEPACGWVEVPMRDGHTLKLDIRDARRIDGACVRLAGGEPWVYVQFSHPVLTRGKKKLLHRYLLDTPDRLIVDHENDDGCDCRRFNIRNTTLSKNTARRRKTKPRKYPYRGLHYIKENDKWTGRIVVNGKYIHLGTWNTQEEAALAYNRAALKYFGPTFSRLNVIGQQAA